MHLGHHPRDNRLPGLSERAMRFIASTFARIDALHHGSADCWVALLECSHDESMGRGFLIPVARWVVLPNVAGRYLAKIVGSSPATGEDRVEISYRCCPEHSRTVRVTLDVGGKEIGERGIDAKAFRSRAEADAWLRAMTEMRDEAYLRIAET